MANIKKVEKKETGLVIFGDGDFQKKRDFFVTGETVDKILEQIEKQVLEHVPDTSTAKGRSAIKANVTVATKYKTFLESEGKKLSAEQKSIPKKIDATRNKIEKFMVDLQKEARQELTDWEVEQDAIAEKKKQEEIKAKILADNLADWESALLADEIFTLKKEKQKQIDDRAAEELEEQKKKDQIAHDKQVAESARVEADQKAKDDIALANKAKQDAIDLTAQLKQEAIDADIKAKQDAINAANLAVENEAYSDDYAFNAEVKRLADIEQSRLDEVQRQKDVKAKVDAETLARENDKEHRRKINRANAKVLADNGISAKDAVKVVTLIAQKLLPNIFINY